MNCSFLTMPSGNIINMDQITNAAVEELKNGYYANVIYANGARNIISEGWKLYELALECLMELLSWICGQLGGNITIRIGDFMDFCPTTALKGGKYGPDEIVSAQMNTVYGSEKIGAYNREIGQTTQKINNIFK